MGGAEQEEMDGEEEEEKQRGRGDQRRGSDQEFRVQWLRSREVGPGWGTKSGRFRGAPLQSPFRKLGKTS